MPRTRRSPGPDGSRQPPHNAEAQTRRITMKTTNNAAAVNAISLPKLPKMRKGGNGICLCGCGDTTSGGRFRPGHDARLLAMVLRIERGLMTYEQLGPHAAAVEIEVNLRAAAGLTDQSHAKAQITAADAAGIERKPVAKPKAAKKPRLVKTPKLDVADAPIPAGAGEPKTEVA